MKNNFTHVDPSLKGQLSDIKNLLTEGYDTRQQFMSVEDALNMPNAGKLFKRAIEEIIVAPSQLNLIGETLIRTTYVTGPGRSISVRTLGALDLENFLVAEEGEYPEVSMSNGTAATLELKFAKYGCKFKISEELLEYSTWDLITYQIQQVVNAMARYRDREIFNMLFNRGVLVFDNQNPDSAQIGRTSGRDITGAGNGSMSSEDLIDMYATVVMNGYTPDVILCHPLHWAMFAKDPILRDAGVIKGNMSDYVRALTPALPPQGMFPRTGVQGLGALTQEVTNPEMEALSSPKVRLPSYSPLSGLKIITSPLVPFNRELKSGSILMLDTENSGLLAISEPLQITEWDEQRNDLKVIKFKEKWALGVIDNGAAIAVARNIAFAPNEVNVTPQMVLKNIEPIKRKG